MIRAVITVAAAAVVSNGLTWAVWHFTGKRQGGNEA